MGFSETDADGVLRSDSMSESCFGCHAGREGHAFLFGIPGDYAL